jgi:hypothetical protein
MSKIFTAKSNGIGLDFQSETQQALFKEDLKQNVGKVYQIKRIVPIRSLNQNKLYWAYLSMVEAETGNNSSDLHEYFKRTLLPPKFITVLGKEIKIPMSTTELNKSDFIIYMDKISALTGVPLPTTEEIQNYTDYMI